MPVTADTIYNLIRSFQGQFSVPAPFVTIRVGTFNAATGQFSGLTTRVIADPEPVEHQPGQHPTNPPPHFSGETWVSVTIDSHFRKTTTIEPAPHAPFAPVLLRFDVIQAAAAWSVTVNGSTINAPPSQTTILVNLWDAANATWTVQSGGKSHHDALKIQRPRGVLGAGVGAFTIPVLPVTIVYAPPADSLGASAATYTQGQTVGTTVSTSFGQDSSHTAPDIGTSYGTAQQFKGFLDTAIQVLSLPESSGSPNSQPIGQTIKVLTDISAQLGQFTSTVQTGISDLTESQMTLTQSTTDSISTNAKAGGPGAGDVVHFYKNVRLIWAFFNGQFRLTPLDFQEVFATATGLKNNAGQIGIAPEDAQLLLTFDPFAANGSDADLPTDRFSLQQTWEYGFGVTLGHQISTTRDTKTQTTTKSFTTTTVGWDPGPIFQLLGLGHKDQTTTTISNATGSDVSSTITMAATLASGPQDYFVVEIWYDSVFGTFAFRQQQPSAADRLQGSGVAPGQLVTLHAGKAVFCTVADAHGNFRFRARSIPAGSATVAADNQPARAVTVKP